MMQSQLLGKIFLPTFCSTLDCVDFCMNYTETRTIVQRRPGFAHLTTYYGEIMTFDIILESDPKKECVKK